MWFSPGLVALLGGGGILVLLVGLWLPSYARSRDMRRRLGLLATGSAGITVDLGGRRRARGVPRTRSDSRNRFVQSIERRLESAALELTPGEIFGAMAVLTAVGGLIGTVLVGPLVGAAAAGVGIVLPLLWLEWRKRRRQGAFLKQLPEVVSLLSSTVRAGHSLVQAFEQVAREAQQPTKAAFEQTVREIGLGAHHDEALERLSQRFPSEDLDLIVASMSVQQQVGGSLSAILDEMAETLAARDRLRSDINALTAQQRYSAYVLSLLPVAVTGALFLVSRDYISTLFEGLLRIVVGIAGLMVLIGFLVMRRMADIDA